MIASAITKRSILLVAIVAAIGVGAVAGAASPWLALASVVAAGFVLVALRWPIALVLGLTASLIAGQLIRLGFSEGAGNVLVTDLLLPVVLGAWIVIRLVEGGTLQLHSRLWIPAAVWIFAMALSLVTGLPRLGLDSGEARVAVLYAVRWVLYFGAFLLTLDVVRSIRTAQLVIYGLLAAGVAIAALGFIQLAVLPDFSSFVPQGWDPHVGRLLSTWFDPNFVGGLFAFLVPIALGLAWESSGRTRVVLLGTAAVLLAALVLTYSRSAYAGLVVGVGLFAVLRARILLVVGALAAIIAFIAVPRIQERVIGVRSVDETAQLRIVSWNNALEVVRDYPLTGIGYNAYRFAQVQYGFLRDPAEHSAGGSDSSVLTVAVTTGAVGLAAYLALVFAQVAQAAAGITAAGSRKGLSLGTLCGFAALIVHGQFINGWFFPHLMLATWIVFGVLAALDRKSA